MAAPCPVVSPRSVHGPGWAALALAAVLPHAANAQSVPSSPHTTGPVGSPETISVPFAASGGVTTANPYTGPVEIRVSGTGNADGSLRNDAFYYLPGQTATGAVQTTPFYQLGIGTAGAPFVGTPPRTTVQSYITVIYGVGPVAAGTIPGYSATNTYDFVINVPDAQPTALTFGVLDGFYGDNGGAFSVTVTQLPGAPEASPAAALGLGVLGLAALRLKARRRPT